MKRTACMCLLSRSASQGRYKCKFKRSPAASHTQPQRIPFPSYSHMSPGAHGRSFTLSSPALGQVVSERLPYLGSGLHGCLQNSRLRAARGLRGWRRPCCICLHVSRKQQGKNITYRFFQQRIVRVLAQLEQKALAGSDSAFSRVC